MSSSKKPKPSTIPADDIPPQSKPRAFDYKDGLGVFITHPEKNPEGKVIEYDDDFVVINDKFPKARSVTLHAPIPLSFPNPTLTMGKQRTLACTPPRPRHNKTTPPDLPLHAPAVPGQTPRPPLARQSPRGRRTPQAIRPAQRRRHAVPNRSRNAHVFHFVHVCTGGPRRARRFVAARPRLARGDPGRRAHAPVDEPHAYSCLVAGDDVAVAQA